MDRSVMPLLQLDSLTVEYRGDGEVVRAVDDVTLSVETGESLAIVGESGSGKTTLALAVTRLIQPPGSVVAGRALFEGRDLFALRADELRRVRGGRISYVFQDPATSLNPVLTVGEQLSEAIELHTDRRAERARAYGVELLERVGIRAAPQRYDAYPHELSGGMRQRVMIAMAIATRPKLLIADEPTTALDVTVQVQILRLLVELQRDLGLSMLLITHDLTIVERTCARVAVMYAGRLVEEGAVADVFANPAHPYTRGLLACRPAWGAVGRQLSTMPGQSPDLAKLPPGCAFVPRCPLVEPRCRERLPTLDTTAEGRRVRCVKPFSKPGA